MSDDRQRERKRLALALRTAMTTAIRDGRHRFLASEREWLHVADAVQPLIEARAERPAPETARYMVVSIDPVQPGDAVLISERQADGTWGPPRVVIVADDTANTEEGEDK